MIVPIRRSWDLSHVRAVEWAHGRVVGSGRGIPATETRHLIGAEDLLRAMADDPLRVVPKGKGRARAHCTFRQDLAGNAYRSARDALMAHAVAFDLDDPAWATMHAAIVAWFEEHALSGIVQSRGGRVHALTFAADPWLLEGDGRGDYIARVRWVYKAFRKALGTEAAMDEGLAQPEKQFWPYYSREDAEARTLYMRIDGAAIDLERVDDRDVREAAKVRKARAQAREIEGPKDLQPALDLMNAWGWTHTSTDVKRMRGICPLDDEHSTQGQDAAFIDLETGRIGCWHHVHAGPILEQRLRECGDPDLLVHYHAYLGNAGHAYQIAEYLQREPEEISLDPRAEIKLALTRHKRVMLAADPGTGKTHAAGELAVERAAEGERVLLLVPRHEVGEEIAERIEPIARSISLPILRPKANVSGCEELRPDLYPHLVQLGVSPATAGFCGGCEHLQRCPTSPLAPQWGEPEAPCVTIATHANLPKALDVGGWSRVIVDETPQVIRTWDNLNPEQILEHCEPNGLYSRIEIAEDVRVRLAALENGFQPGTEIANGWIQKAAADLGSLARAAEHPAVVQLLLLQDALASGATRDEKGWSGLLPTWRALAALDVPIALLDASMDPIAARLLHAEPIRVAAPDQVGSVVRTWHPIATSTARHWSADPTSWASSLQRHVAPLIEQHQEFLVGFNSIAQGEMGADLLGLQDEQWTYPGRLTGVNRWDSVTLIVAWGALSPNLAAAQRMARIGGVPPSVYPGWVASGNLTQLMGRARVVSPWAPKRDVHLHVFGPVAPMDWNRGNSIVAPPERLGRPRGVRDGARLVEEALERFGGSAAELARMLGVNRSAVAKWRNGSRPVPPIHVEAMRSLNVTK